MPTKPSVAIQTSNTQAKNRRGITVYDQHKSSRFPLGRPWWGFAEKPSEAGMPWGIVGTLNPGNHEEGQNRDWSSTWEAPWYPDAKWMVSDLEKGKLTINYTGMIAEYTNANRAYYNKCAEKADENKWQAPVFGGPVDSKLRAVVGRDVPQSPKIPQAAMAGDPWILGTTSEVNERLYKIIKNTVFGSGVSVMEYDSEGDNSLLVTAATSSPDIQAMIDAAVSKALSAQPAKTPNPARVAAAQKMREAKEAKKQASAQANAA